MSLASNQHPTFSQPYTPFQSGFVFGTVRKPDTEAELEPKPEPKGHVAGFLASLKDDTDLKINLNLNTWKVHSKLLTEQSSFFKAACSEPWKESRSRVIDLHDDDPWIFSRFLQFIYTKDYEGSNTAHGCPDITEFLTLKLLAETGKSHPNPVLSCSLDARRRKMVIHFMVYEVGDKYDCPALREHARKNIEACGCGEEVANLRELLDYKDVDSWRRYIDKDEDLKKIMARKIAVSYKKLKNLPCEDNKGDSSAREWLRWLDEDISFCHMVLDIMSGMLTVFSALVSGGTSGR